MPWGLYVNQGAIAQPVAARLDRPGGSGYNAGRGNGISHLLAKEAVMTEEGQDTGGTGQEQPRSSAEEWKDIFQGIEQQIRRECARIVGVAEDSDWATIGRQAGEATRKGVAKGVGAGEEADWEEIGGHVERTARSGIGGAVGASPDADWATVGQTVDQKVRSFLQDLFGGKVAPKGEEEEEEGMVDPWT